jgi:hypothetical protein
MSEKAAKPPDWHTHYLDAKAQLAAASKAVKSAQNALDQLAAQVGGFGTQPFGAGPFGE